MKKFQDLSIVELAKVTGGKKPKHKRNRHALCPYVATGLAVAGGVLTGSPLGAAGGFVSAYGTSFCN